MVDSSRYKKLLEPYHIGSVKTRNRIIKTGASMMYWHDDDTYMRENVLAYYEAIARGGVGLLIVESPTIDYPWGCRWKQRYRLDDDKYIKGLNDLVQVIKKHNCPTFMQMNHDGPWQNPLFPPDPPTYEGPPVGASPLNLTCPTDFHRDIIKPLTITEIETIVDKFASAAVRAKKAGFDGTDINAASSHLFHNFLSPYWNRRTDDYGGSVENRARFIVSVVKEIRKRVGPDFAISVCINGIEIGQAIGVDNKTCLTVEDSQKVARMLQEAGTDLLHIRNHWLGLHAGGFLPDLLFYPDAPVPVNTIPKEYYWKQKGAAANMYLARGIKQSVSIPVMVVGRFNPELGEKALRNGMADFIGMNRRLNADPDLPDKLAENKIDDIAPCTACETCLDAAVQTERRCRINAAISTNQYTIDTASKKKKVVVIGGGPAGMEAARVAALRGHDVTLYEKYVKLGGLLLIAALVKGSQPEDLSSIVRYLQRQINNLGVKVILGKEVDASLIEMIKPDAVIIATGGTLAMPDIPGIGKPIVINNLSLHHSLKSYLKYINPETLRSLTRFFLPVGKKVVIIGGGLQGFELAEFLTKRGRKVTIVDTRIANGYGMIGVMIGALMPWFQKKGVNIISSVKSMEVTDKGLSIVTEKDEKQLLEADNIVPAMPMQPNTALFNSLQGIVPEVYSVGDCRDPRLIVDAIADSWRICQKL